MYKKKNKNINITIQNRLITKKMLKLMHFFLIPLKKVFIIFMLYKIVQNKM